MVRMANSNFSLHPKFNKQRRKSVFKVFIMDFGKFLHFLSITLILKLMFVNSTSPSNLKGGLVYSEVSERGPIYLNPQTYTVTRDVDTSSLTSFCKFITRLKNLYDTQCSKVLAQYNEIKPVVTNEQLALVNFQPRKFYFSMPNVHLHQAEKACRSHKGGLLPEARNKHEKEHIRQNAIELKVPRVVAGIKFHTETRRFRFMSDLGDVSVNSPFPDIEYGGTYGSNTHHKEKINAQDGIVQTMAADFLVIYDNPEGDFVLRLADLKQLNSEPANILCQYPITPPHVHEDKRKHLTCCPSSTTTAGGTKLRYLQLPQ